MNEGRGVLKLTRLMWGDHWCPMLLTLMQLEGLPAPGHSPPHLPSARPLQEVGSQLCAHGALSMPVAKCGCFSGHTGGHVPETTPGRLGCLLAWHAWS